MSGFFIVLALAKSPKTAKFAIQIAEIDQIPRFNPPNLHFFGFFALEIEMFQNYFEVLLDA